MSFKGVIPSDMYSPGKTATEVRMRELSRDLGRALFPKRPIPIVYDDVLNKETSMSTGVTIDAEDVRHAKQLLSRGENHPYLAITPERDYNPGIQEGVQLSSPLRALPTDKFRIEWNGPNERFSKVVTGLAELLAVIKPIIKLNLDAKKQVEQAQQKEDMETRKQRMNSIREQIRKHRESADKLEQQLED